MNAVSEDGGAILRGKGKGERPDDEFGGGGLLFEIFAGYSVEKSRRQLERGQSHVHRWMRLSHRRGRKVRREWKRELLS